MAYFEPAKVEFITSGSQILDCVLGGGWAVGRVINIVGDKSSGKCCRNSYSITENGFELIDRVGSHLSNGLTEKTSNLTVDSNTTAQSSHFWKEIVNHTIKVVTKHGYEIEGTPDHRIKVLTQNCQLEMKRLGDLTINDVAIIVKSPQYTKTDLFKITFKSKHLPNIQETPIKIPEFVDEKLGYFLGLLVADVNIINNHAIHFNNEQAWFKEKLTWCLKNIFGIDHNTNHQLGAHQIENIQLNEFISWLIELGEHVFTAKNKYIPRCILESPKSVQAQFLRALISCNSDWNQFGIDYITASEILAQDVHVLLLNFGVISSKYSKIIKEDKYNTYWGIYISSSYVNQYIKDIGSDNISEKLNNDNFNIDVDNYYFDPIAAIIHKHEPVEVYDYHIPNTHLFWSNGFISHNTLLAIEACVNLLLKYPDAYIWYVDSEAAFDESYVTGLGIPVEKFKFIPAETMEDVHNMLDDKIANANSKNHGIIVIDSYDALSDEKEKERLIEDGSYKTDKIKMLGEFFRRNVTRLEKKNITTMVINQVRDVLNSRFHMKTKTGGNTLNHNANQIVWLSEIGKTEKTVNGVKRVTGLNVKAKVTKNKVGMPFRECTFDVLLGYGVDDLGSNLKWLNEVKKPFTYGDKVYNSDLLITNFVKKCMESPHDEFMKIRIEVAAKVKTEWDSIEEGFRPPTKKYIGLVESKPELEEPKNDD